ncbi:MAG TPA: PEP-CTERM sorting domain-containing protein [Stellaceae bacterium]|jgi:hypothetical protein
MMRRAAYALCAALCLAGLASGAQAAAVTYTWETISNVPPNNGLDGPAPPLSLSFTVNGDLSLSTDSLFAPPPTSPTTPPTPYPFPPQLASFNLHVGNLSITLADFTTEGFDSQTPIWTIGLTADPADGTASLSLFFINARDTDEVYGTPPGSENPAQISTGAVGTISYGSDAYETSSPAQYAGMLVASAAVPEPRSLWVLLGGLGMLGLIHRRRGPVFPPLEPADRRG